MEAVVLHPDVRVLKALLEPSWTPMLNRLRASGVPLNEGGAGTVNINAPITIESLEARQDAIKSRMAAIHNEFSGQALPDDVKAEWNELGEERKRNTGLIGELRVRVGVLEALSDDSKRQEEGATFNTPTRYSGDTWDYSHVRAATSLEGQRSMLRDQAMRAVEKSRFPHPLADEARCQADIERLLTRDDEHGTLALRLLNTGSPLYQRAFSKTLQGSPVTQEEQRALGLTNSAGGYAVPFTLDPTIINTSNGSVNPYRQIARIEQIVGTTWQGVTSAGVTATRRSEADETTDNAPTLAQPSVTPQRVDVFIPLSMEIDQDWGGLQAQLARLIQDAKDDEEAASFTTGTGTPPAAQGVVTGATTTVTLSGTASFATGDVYTIEQALPPRFRSRASWVGNRAIFNKVRQFDTSGGASLWTDNLRAGLTNTTTGAIGYNLIGYPAYESSSTASVLTTGSKVLVFGDFSYFIIVDRLGMNVEVVPHLFGSNRRPTLQRGIVAVWRNNSRVIDPAAFRVGVTG
jgi:HK97 family phage major capsid protein